MSKIFEIFNFDNIGGKIKNLAKWSCWIAIILTWIGATIGFFVFLFTEGMFLFAIMMPITAVLLSLVIWVSSWGLYALGEYVENTESIRYSNRRILNIDKNLQVMAKLMIDEAKERKNGETKDEVDIESQTNSKSIVPEETSLSENTSNDKVKESENSVTKDEVDIESQTNSKPIVPEETSLSENTSNDRVKESENCVTKDEVTVEAKTNPEPIVPEEKNLSEKLNYALLFQSHDGMINHLKGIQDERVQNILKLPKNMIRAQIKMLLADIQSK